MKVLYIGITLQFRYQQRKYIYWLLYATVKKRKEKKNFKKKYTTDVLFETQYHIRAHAGGGPCFLLSPPPSTFWRKKKENKRNTHFQIKRIFDGIRIFDWQTSPNIQIDDWSHSILYHIVILTENDYLYKTQEHPATMFCKITVQRSKYCLEISKAWEELKNIWITVPFFHTLISRYCRAW